MVVVIRHGLEELVTLGYLGAGGRPGVPPEVAVIGDDVNGVDTALFYG